MSKKEKPSHDPWKIWGLSGDTKVPIVSIFFIDILKQPKGGK
jgi:hypothetical protein